MFLFLTVFLLCGGKIFSSSLTFFENVSFRDKIIKNYKTQKFTGCQISVLNCSQLCYEDFLCVSFFYQDSCNICQLHSVKFADSAAGLSQTGWKYYSVNKAEIKPRDCEDVFKLGNSIDGVYSIYRNGSQYDVYCDMNRRGWTVFQRRFNGFTDFYRDWNSYETGFGNVTGEFWLGLDKIYELTSSATYSLRFDMEDFDGVWKYALYSNFKLGDRSAGYILNYDTYIGNAGDALNRGKGYRFSTYDNDNDNYHGSCSVLYGGAWWYNDCHHSNLNGLYNNTLFGKGINWYQWHGHYYSLKTTEIKIRRT